MKTRMIEIVLPSRRDLAGQQTGEAKLSMSVHRAVASRDFLRRLPAPDTAQQALLAVVEAALAADERAAASEKLGEGGAS